MLDEALGWTGTTPPRNTVLLIEDSVSSPASFLLPYLLNKVLASPEPFVIFVGLKEPFSHYARIAKKQGCNLLVHQERGTLAYIDLLSQSNADVPDSLLSKSFLPRNKLFPLFWNFVKMLKQAPRRNVWIIFDDISLLEVLTEGNGAHLVDFLHYCRTLASDKQALSLGLFTHEDVYDTENVSSLIHQLEHLSDTVIRVKPLGTGQAVDVHGQLVVEHRMPCGTGSMCASSVNSFANGRGLGLHYKLMESSAAFFAPGKIV